MNDLISRQAAIDAVNELTKWYWETYHEKRPTTGGVIDKLMELPSAQQWIPVTERLPEESETVIASVDAEIYPEARFVDGRWWWALEAFADYWEEIKKDVTAWMPLPEPYRKGANPP